MSQIHVLRLKPKQDLKESLLNYAKEKKIPMLRDEVMAYVQSGTTTVEEALRILYNVEN
jgi:type II secretory ATPase GspE/PulE/Tfp pilus assembly ATPase PilB-like protein